VRRALFAEVIGDARQRGDNALLAFEFGIEDAQRIRFDAALAVRARACPSPFRARLSVFDVPAAAVIALWPMELISS